MRSPTTIAELLQQTCEGEAEGAGSTYSVFRLDRVAPKFKGYGLRIAKGLINKEALDRSLAHHSILYPPSTVLTLPFGAQLLSSDPRYLNSGFQIVRLEEGETLTKWALAAQGNDPSSIMHEKAIAVMDRVLNRKNQKKNPFEDILDGVYRLTRDGHFPDLRTPDNILMTEDGRLTLVDQISIPLDISNPGSSGTPKRARQAVEENAELLHVHLSDPLCWAQIKPRQSVDSETPSAAVSETYKNKREAIGKLIDAAAKKIMKRYETTEPKTAFAKVSQIHAVNMQHAPSALLQSLHDIEREAHSR